jgi:tRNA threonylcarbamoyladenosine biosynthesis protein TsaE
MTVPTPTPTSLSKTLTVEVSSRSDLDDFCQWLSNSPLKGEVWALDGELGAGKTTLVQNFCRQLGVEETISSPTFVLLNEYLSGPLPIVHGDFYRLGEQKADGLMQELTPYLEQGNGLILMEWASLSKAYQKWVTLWISLNYGPNPTERTLTLKSTAPQWHKRFSDYPAQTGLIPKGTIQT